MQKIGERHGGETAHAVPCGVNAFKFLELILQGIGAKKIVNFHMPIPVNGVGENTHYGVALPEQKGLRESQSLKVVAHNSVPTRFKTDNNLGRFLRGSYSNYRTFQFNNFRNNRHQ
ncbi:hypothetical protein [Falsihalocynthiibacter arcticus]|uniref:hypothetical protein n=1 Tax=Falsihalocynthiibacter arcticus TaxID=1579316 RepID=UPI0012E711D4|nr:hypothetical protein [Falsihalocynthiibacter arcticus]